MVDSQDLVLNPFIEVQAKHVKLIRPDGDQWIFRFRNGFGASVVRHNFSYGNLEGLFELAVLDSNDCITYDTSITDDVLGWQSVEDIRAALLAIAELKVAINS